MEKQCKWDERLLAEVEGHALGGLYQGHGERPGRHWSANHKIIEASEGYISGKRTNLIVGWII